MDTLRLNLLLQSQYPLPSYVSRLKKTKHSKRKIIFAHKKSNCNLKENDKIPPIPGTNWIQWTKQLSRLNGRLGNAKSYA